MRLNVGTHISNTREAKAFALLSEEGIAKGIRRVTAVTTDFAFEALKRASELEQEVNEASKLEGSLLEQVGLFNYAFRLKISVHISILVSGLSYKFRSSKTLGCV